MVSARAYSLTRVRFGGYYSTMLEYEKNYHRLCNLSLAANVFIVGNKIPVDHIKEKKWDHI